jgi:hypothetical protein
MNIAATTAAEGFPRRAFTVEDISRMIQAGVIREDEKFELIEGGNRDDGGQRGRP